MRIYRQNSIVHMVTNKLRKLGFSEVTMEPRIATRLSFVKPDIRYHRQDLEVGEVNPLMHSCGPLE